MSGINTSIQITDRVSGSLNRITAALYNTTSAFHDVDVASDAAFNNTSGIQAMSQEMYRYEQRVQQLENDLVDANNRLEQMEEKTKAATNAANMLRSAFSAVKGIMAALAIKEVVEMSDSLVQTTSRLNMMNDGMQTTEELVQMVYASAQDARGEFGAMADVVARFGNNAKDAFSSNEEVVAFSNLIQKYMTVAGASTSEASNAMLQLSQGLGSGVLRGDELNSIFEQAPNLIQAIADYMDVPIGSIREMASEGQLTADIVKAAIFASADDINEKFANMPMTWGQVWTSMKNTAIMAFQPVLQQINNIANGEQFQTMMDGITKAMYTVGNVASKVFGFVASIGAFVANHWSVIAPIIGGVVAALGAYLTYLAVMKIAELIGAGVKIIMCVASYAHAAATGTEASATAAATAAQYGLNSALLACPLTWIILAIIALIAIIFALCNWIAKTTEVANTGFGVICGGINVVLQFFKNLGLAVANIAIGMWNALGALCDNMGVAFKNTISGVQSWFYNLLSTALTVVAGIAEALNKLPFVEFDYSGITSKASEYANKAAEASANKGSYTSVSDAFNEGMSTFDAFGSGWASDAFDSGAAWGDGVADKISGMFSSLDTSALTDGFDPAYTDDGAGSLADAANATAGNTSDIANSLDVSNEQLKYLRDIAERDAINKFTTAEIKVDMTNNNNISSGVDLDGIITSLSDGLREAMEVAAEGV